MKKKDLFLCLAVLLLLLTACGEKQPEHTHNWEPANCSRGELCFNCGETRGEALGHDWTDATCTVAKRCSRCGVTEGASLGGHVSDGSGNCSRCGEELNVVAKIDATTDIGMLSYSDPHPTVYDGVVFEFPFSGYRGYPTDYVICDPNGGEVASGTWPEKPPYVLGKDALGKWIWNLSTCTKFVPLEPGTYTVTYHFYSDAVSDTNPYIYMDSVWVPKGDLKTGRCTLTVK